MVERDHVVSILKINGVNSNATDDEIRSVLRSARYSKDEVDFAITVLRENIEVNKNAIDGLHCVFRTNKPLTSEQITKLLGIEVNIDQSLIKRRDQHQASLLHYMMLWLLSVGIALFGILSYMYIHQFGPFYQGVQASVYK